MRYILDVDGYIENVAFGSQIVNSSGVACTEYTGAMPDGFDSLDEWAHDAYIRAYKIVDGNLVLDSARLAYLKAKEKSEDEENRHVTAKELYDIINVQSSVTEEEFTAQTSGNNLLVIDGAGEQVIPKMSIKKVVNWNDLTGKTWNELRYKMAIASGDIMSLTDAYNNAPIQAFKLYGKSVQNGTPTPTSPATIVSIENPTITVCGKNLFDAETKMPIYGVFSKQADGSWYVPNAGQAHNKVLWSNTSNYIGAMTISWYGKFDSSSSRGGGIWVRFSDDSIVSVNSSVYIAMFNTFSKAVLTINSTTEKPIKEIIFSYADSTATYFKDIQIEFGSTATDYESYKNGGSVSIGGGAKYTNQVPISTDKDGNIYNGIGYQNNTRVKSSGAVVTDSAGNSFTTGFIPCKSGDVIRFSGHYIEGADGALNTTFYAQDKATRAGYGFTPYSWKNASSTGVEANYSPYEYDATNSRVLWFTVPQKASGYQDIAYVQFTLVSSGGNGNGVVITVNEEIVVDTKTFRSVGDIKDELVVNKDGTGKITQKIGKYEFDGTETIGRNEQYGYVYYIAELSDLGGKSQARESILPDRYVASTAIATNGVMYMRPNGNGFILHDDRYQALADLKAYLKAQKAAGTPLTVLYELATPIETELTADEVSAILSLKTFSPTTVIANDKGAKMEVTYANGVSTWDTIGKGTDVVSQVEIISSNKNILPCLVPSQTLNGLTITQNEDYSFTLDGTATADTEITLAGTTMSTEALFCMRLGTEFVKSGLGDLSLKLYDYDGIDRTLLHSGGNGTITPTESYRITHATLSIPNGTTLSEVTISPQIEVCSTATEYIPNKRDYKKITASMDSGDILTIDNGTVKLNNSVIDYGSNVKTFKDKSVLMISTNSFVEVIYYLPNVIESLKHMKIKADQIDLEGYTTINDGFSIDLEGNMTAKSGAVAGWDITEDGFAKSGKCLINNAVCDYDIKVSRPQGAGSAISISTDYNDGTTFEIYPAGIAIKNQGSSFLSGTTLRIGNTNYSSLLDCQPNGVIFYVGDINGANQLLFDANADTKLHLKGGNALADNGSWVNGSLESRKREIEEYKANALSIVKSNKIYSYLYNIEDDKANRHYGFVIPDKEDSKYKAPIECISAGGEGIDTYSMTAVLWKAVQELSAEIEQLKNKEEKA